jgi:hypothetical protein
MSGVKLYLRKSTSYCLLKYKAVDMKTTAKKKISPNFRRPMAKDILCAFLRPLAPSACGLISARKDPEMWNDRLRNLCQENNIIG